MVEVAARGAFDAVGFRVGARHALAYRCEARPRYMSVSVLLPALLCMCVVTIFQSFLLYRRAFLISRTACSPSLSRSPKRFRYSTAMHHYFCAWVCECLNLNIHSAVSRCSFTVLVWLYYTSTAAVAQDRDSKAKKVHQELVTAASRGLPCTVPETLPSHAAIAATALTSSCVVYDHWGAHSTHICEVVKRPV